MKEHSNDVLQSPNSPIEHQLTIGPTTSTPARPPIVQVYARSREIDDTCSALVPLLSNLSSPDSSKNLDLPIALRKGKRTCQSTYSIANFVSYDRLSSMLRSLVASLIPKNSEGSFEPSWMV